MIRRAVAGAVVSIALVGMTAAPANADSIRDRQWHLTDLKIAQVHQITRGAGIIVAVVDTGVDAKHRDLAGSVLPGHNTETSELVDLDETGRTDLAGHGTHMAGLIAARGHGSGDGVLGIAPASKILPIATPIGGFTSSDYVAEAVDFAIAKKARVMNMSFATQDEKRTRDAIGKALAADIVVVAPAGNRGTAQKFPGAYPEVLTVGAYAKDRKIASISETGPQVDLTAPGDKMVTTGIQGSGYDLTTGTSDSTAIVSGAAALVRAKFPELSAAEVVHRLTETADDAGAPGRDDTYGFGRLNLVKALTADVSPLPDSTTAAPGAAPATTTAAAGAQADGADGDDLPKPNDPLILTAFFAGAVLVIGAIAAVLILIVVRRRRTY